MKYAGKLLATLLFIIALLYLVGLIWVAIKGQAVPDGIRIFYPWM